jgi:hypothetical protein
LLAEIPKAPPMFLNDRCGSAIDERFVLEFLCHGAQFGFDSDNFLI